MTKEGVNDGVRAVENPLGGTVNVTLGVGVLALDDPETEGEGEGDEPEDEAVGLRERVREREGMTVTVEWTTLEVPLATLEGTGMTEVSLGTGDEKEPPMSANLSTQTPR